MSTLARQRDIYLPRPPKGMGKGLVLALIVHAALVVALSFSVSWRTSDPVGVDAELWAAVPQVAAPPAVEPEPKPEPRPEPPKPLPKVEPAPVKTPDADIALEREKEKREKERLKLAEKEREEDRLKKAEADKLKKEEAEKARREEQRVAALREAQLKRMMGQAGATGEATSTGTAARTAGPSATWGGRVKGRVLPNIVFPDSLEGNPEAVVEVRLSPDGTIVGRRLIKSSGAPSWDDAVLRAIDKTEVLPRDTDGRVPSKFEIAFKPRE